MYGGITVHVKSKRVVGDPPPLPKYDDPDMDEKLKERKKFFENVKYKSIGLPYDGETFYENFNTIIPRIKMLIEAGYNAPETIIEDILEDIQDQFKSD